MNLHSCAAERSAIAQLFRRHGNNMLSITVALLACFLSLPTKGQAWLLATRSQICATQSTTVKSGDNNIINTVFRPIKRRSGPHTLLLMNQDDDWSSNLSPAWLERSSALASTLARLNTRWETASSTGQPARPWKKLFLPNSDDENTDDASSSKGDADDTDASDNKDFVYLLEPTNQQPSLIILFVGGAVLAQTPHISYGYFLEHLSHQLNATIIADPYTISLDHWSLARKNLQSFQRALLCYKNGIFLSEDESSSTIPIFTISHSLGSKLHILSCAASPSFESLVKGHIILCFNNFGFSQTITMIKLFSQDFQQNRAPPSSPSSVDMSYWLNNIMDVAKQAMDMVGLEFTPSPQETLRIIEKKFTSDMQSKTSLFVMDQDSLDCSSMLLQSCQTLDAVQQDDIIITHNVSGTHLSPVFLQIGLNDLNDEENPMNPFSFDEELVSSILGGFRAASFGNETQTKNLINEVTKCIRSKIIR